MDTSNRQESNRLLQLLHTHLTYRKGMELVNGDPVQGFILARIRPTGAYSFFRLLPVGDGSVLIQRKVYNTRKDLMTESEILVNSENVFDLLAHY